MAEAPLDAAVSLEPPNPGPEAAARFVDEHLADLCGDASDASSRFRGGQSAADAALAGYSVKGYAARRNEVWPEARRGASGLSPYIRHGLLSLPRVWEAVGDGPPRDVHKYRDELLWQEYARHLYARLGRRMARSLRAEPARRPGGERDPWPGGMACMALCTGELERDGWLVNQTRMWLASQWSVRHGARWQDGEDHFFRHLLDGSRAANRLGWQWTVGASGGKAYGFSRWQVEKRAPGLCERCALNARCPIERWPDAEPATRCDAPAALRRDRDLARTSGPESLELSGEPDRVWLTAESLGLDDPALAAWPELPVVFVFDAPLLAALQLSRKRLVFLTETLAELGTHREVELWRGPPADVLADHTPAVTFAPVPGFRTLLDRIDVAALHPWPWLARPVAGPIASFSRWRKGLGGMST